MMFERQNDFMTNGTADERIQCKRLRAVYRAAFRQWASQVRRWQALRSDSAPDGEATNEARNRAEGAEAIYHTSRNLLAECMQAQ